MTIYEVLTLLVSFLAVVVAGAAFVSSRRTSHTTAGIAEEQLAIQRVLAKIQLRAAGAAAEARNRADVMAAFRRTGGKSMHRVVLRNEGLGDALRVGLEFVLRPGQESPLMDEDHLPLENLEAGTEYPLRVVTSTNWVPPAPVVVTWQDPDGQQRSRKVMLDG